MCVIVPTTSSLVFWFNKRSKYEQVFGSPGDVMCKFEVFKSKLPGLQGIEMLLKPNLLTGTDQFPCHFYKTISRLKHKTVHIADENGTLIQLSDKCRYSGVNYNG